MKTDTTLEVRGEIPYSIIESAKLDNLNIFGYLSYLLTELPGIGENPSNDILDKFLPWSETLPNYCKQG